MERDEASKNMDQNNFLKDQKATGGYTSIKDMNAIASQREPVKKLQEKAKLHKHKTCSSVCLTRCCRSNAS